MNDLRFSEYFMYTQYSLSTFENCPLKFKMRYLENLKWNGINLPEVKERLELGNDFHLLAYRYFMGIEKGVIEVSDELLMWMNNLINDFKINEDYIYLPEYKLRLSLEDLKLEANFDLLIVKEDSIEIWDWKTHDNNSGKSKGNSANRLIESLQTKVYMFVLNELSSLIYGEKLGSEKISMHYWQPSPPKVLTEIKYSKEMHNQFRNILKGKIDKINCYDYSYFDKGLFIKHCKECEFNWFCNKERIDFNSINQGMDLSG